MMSARTWCDYQEGTGRSGGLMIHMCSTITIKWPQCRLFSSSLHPSSCPSPLSPLLTPLPQPSSLTSPPLQQSDSALFKKEKKLLHSCAELIYFSPRPLIWIGLKAWTEGAIANLVSPLDVFFFLHLWPKKQNKLSHCSGLWCSMC